MEGGKGESDFTCPRSPVLHAHLPPPISPHQAHDYRHQDLNDVGPKSQKLAAGENAGNREQDTRGGVRGREEGEDDV